MIVKFKKFTIYIIFKACIPCLVGYLRIEHPILTNYIILAVKLH